MPWYDKIVPETVKKSVCAYLLQRYLGQFFEEKLTRDQLSVDLYNGTGTVEKVSLDVQALNELGEKQNWPMEFVDGFIEKLHISVPWASILKDPSFVEVRGLKITVQPKQRNEYATSMFESMWNSMSSSLKLAEECAKQDAKNSANEDQTYEGLELFAKTIDSILSRVKVKFIDSIIQIEHVPKDSHTGVGIVINVDLIEYSDEAGNDPSQEEITDLTSEDANKAYVVQTFTTKNFNIEGVTMSTVEFSSKARTFSRSMMNSSQTADEEELHSFITVVEQPTKRDNDCLSPKSPDETATEKQSVEQNQRYVVMFARFSNRQEIKVGLKQSENVNGPKVSIELNLGSLILFLSPRQVHVLSELANGLSKPDMEDHSNVPQRPRCTEKPMTSLDYQRVENELQQQLQPHYLHGVGLQGMKGWSTAPLDESDPEDNFMPMQNTASGMYDSAINGASSSMESSLSSNMTGSFSDQTARSRRRVSTIDVDPTAEISHFQIRIASVAAILLHEDIINVSSDEGHTLVLSSVKQMQATVKMFFKDLGQFIFNAYGGKDFENAKTIFERACHLSHLRLMAAPVQIEGDEKTTSTAFSITGQLTAAKLALLECLCDTNSSKTEYVQLLNFQDSGEMFNSNNPSNLKPSLRVSFKHVEKTSRSGLSRRSSGPKTDINVSLNKCSAEFDITIIDRITSLLNPHPVCVVEKTKTASNPWNVEVPVSNNVQVESQTDLKIVSPSITIKIRFPIPDFRPPHDLNRTPWWKQHIRPDSLSLILSDVTFQTSLRTNQTFQEYNINSRVVDVYYSESENSVPLHIGKAGHDEKYLSSMQEILQHPTVNLKIFPEKKIELEEPELEGDVMVQSVFCGAFTNKPCGPFSSKKVVHESDTPHTKPQKDETEELVIPGDKEEIEEFIKATSTTAKIKIDILLPLLSLQFVSKHIYELIYNRINNDLLLWESSAPKPKQMTSQYYDYSALNNIVPETQDVFITCKSGIQYDSESDSDDGSEDDGAILFYSACDKMKRPKKAQIIPESKDQSFLVLNLQVSSGIISLHTPVRDVTTNNVIPGQNGEFSLNVDNAVIFLVNGYKGDKDLGYVCLQVSDTQLYHCDMIAIPSRSPPLKEIGAMISKHLSPTIYKSERGMLTDSKERGSNRELLSVAIKIQAKHETHHVKTVKVAIGLNKATLRHKMCSEPNSWISHILDFFNVQDYPIPGYNAKEVLTELHLNLWDCAIDYRPHYLPLRSAVTLGNFSMSSHLSEKSNTSTLRFIAEDCGLYLSDKYPPREGLPSSTPVELKRDYVNVIGIGLFELSLRTNDKKSGVHPHIDLRASNDCVHIHTCSDTGRALTQLITYIATDGDLVTTDKHINVDSAYSSPRHEPADQELINVEPPQDISKLSVSQHQQVNDLLGEAMEESLAVEGSEKERLMHNSGAKLFFFPDENQITQELGKPFPQIVNELGDVTLHSNTDSDSDDSFYMVGDEAGLGLFPKNGIPEIKWLTNDTVRVVENHFTIPIGKTDLLKPPKGFPVPVLRYTLCEMNLIWHMYGGCDFKSSDLENKKKKTVNFSDVRMNDRVSFSNSRQGEVKFTAVQSRESSLPWQAKGGVNRDHKVLMELQLNKVKFQHETYPENAVQSSRQVLLISELEVRDRLASSQFNKFLYQYTSQARPKQSRAHMIVIKAIHIRPDPKLTSEECCLRVSLLPLRLNIDQDSLLFLINFFGELGGNSSKEDDGMNLSSKHNTPTHHPPVMTISTNDEEEIKEQAHKIVDDNLLILLEENKLEDETESVTNVTTNSSSSPPVFFRNVLFSPEVPIRLDYQGKHVKVTDGSLAGLLIGLLMGLGQLNCSELRLKRISHRHGLLGVEKLMTFLLQEWLNDIKKNQLPSLLGGVGPIHSLVQLFHGVKDLFWLPIEQYQKDGRIVRGLQRGANSFTTSTAMAALELTSRLIHLIQITAETAYDMLSPGPSVRRIPKTKGKRKRYNQPQDIREGMANAYMLVKEGIGETADNIVQIASHEHEQKGYSGAVGGVLRQIPPTILKPIIIASEATSNVLGGMRSQLVPDARREANQKWRNNVS